MSGIRFLRNLIKLARISLNEDDSGRLPVQHINYMGKTTPCLIIMPYGTHANVPVDTLNTVFACNGDEGNLHAIPHIQDKRIKDLSPGEFVTYHPETKSMIHYKNDGTIHIVSNNDLVVDVVGDLEATIAGNATVFVGGEANATVIGDVNLTAPNINLNGDVNIDGNLDVTGGTSLSDTVTSNGKDISDTSRHSGVTPGLGNSGIVV